jgi:serine/threonine-protein kinase
VIGAPIGQGTFGVVYEARTRSIGRRVALKVMHADVAEDPTHAERFRREASIVAQLHHPNIVDVYDRGFAHGRHYIAMELLEGETLAQLLKRETRLSVPAAIGLMLPIFSAVEAVHRLGVVHRDLKPANIFLSHPRPGVVHPKLLDFGLVRLSRAAEEITRVDVSLGTPNYMAPEQVIHAREVDARADVWSLGVLLYTLITGERPFAGPTDHATLINVVENEARPMRALRPDVPAAVDQAVMMALRKRPDERFASAHAFAAAIIAYASPRAQQDFADEFTEAVDAVDVIEQSAPDLDAPTRMIVAPPASPPDDPFATLRVPPPDGPSEPSSFTATRSPPEAPVAAVPRSVLILAALIAAALVAAAGINGLRRSTLQPMPPVAVVPASAPAPPPTPAPVVVTPAPAPVVVAEPTPPPPVVEPAPAPPVAAVRAPTPRVVAPQPPCASLPGGCRTTPPRRPPTLVRPPASNTARPSRDPNGVPVLE